MIALALAWVQPDPVAQLDAELRAATSATAVLQRRCATPIRAIVDRGRVVRPSAAQRRRLRVWPAEPVAYRVVALTCDGVPLSMAQNWYVPARLTPEMRAALAGDTPFGVAIRPLVPHRRLIDARRRGLGTYILRHRALVLDARGVPLAEVVEQYTPALRMLRPVG
ncbi:hypothetical protein ACG3SL_02675 [Sphingomonas sp. CJ20]